MRKKICYSSALKQNFHLIIMSFLTCYSALLSSTINGALPWRNVQSTSTDVGGVTAKAVGSFYGRTKELCSESTQAIASVFTCPGCFQDIRQL